MIAWAGLRTGLIAASLEGARLSTIKLSFAAQLLRDTLPASQSLEKLEAWGHNRTVLESYVQYSRWRPSPGDCGAMTWSDYRAQQAS